MTECWPEAIERFYYRTRAPGHLGTWAPGHQGHYGALFALVRLLGQPRDPRPKEAPRHLPGVEKVAQRGAGFGSILVGARKPDPGDDTRCSDAGC